MIRRRLAGLAAAALTALLAGCAAGGSQADPGSEPAAESVAHDELRVGLDDFEVRLGADAVAAGELRLDVVNVGGDAHDLQVDADGHTLAATDVLARGESGELSIEIPAGAGELELWCTVPGHRSQGMVTTVPVETPTPSGEAS